MKKKQNDQKEEPIAKRTMLEIVRALKEQGVNAQLIKRHQLLH
ncbi:hypothetical protein [Litchfieldia salsa]|uniref:Uncharacterized protein n=1 Tax=Litchfieldia salsa TaxID=930152 RepID=A0A1H0WNY0_9BACI|nr:hypothetical protein [Litchfieldia salsa]SDP92358.1 hypothetical protein SAMN05216565_1132 [Litchfieldia salsa]